MTPARHALASVRHTLEEIARTGDGRRLHQLLHGRELPELGGGEEPAMQIIQALEFSPYDAGLTQDIGRLCANSARRWLEQIEAQNGQETGWSAIAQAIREPPPVMVLRPDDGPVVYNLLLAGVLVSQRRRALRGPVRLSPQRGRLDRPRRRPGPRCPPVTSCLVQLADG